MSFPSPFQEVPQNATINQMQSVDLNVETIINDPEFIEFNKVHPNVWEEIKDIMIANKSVMKLDELALALNADKRFVKHTLDTWVSHWCTFFQYGRIGYDKHNDVWFYLKNSHSQARFHFPRIKIGLNN